LALLVYFMKVTRAQLSSGKLLSGAQEPLEVHQIFPARGARPVPGSRQ